MVKCIECRHYSENNICEFDKYFTTQPDEDLPCGSFGTIKYPICPINIYFEGDKECDPNKCNFDTETRSCTQTCKIEIGQIKILSNKQQPVSHKDYMQLADAYDKHSRSLVQAKGEEYSIDGDFLAMENRLAGMLGDTPEYVSLIMAGKHITSLGIILEKNDVTKVNLEKWDERIRDATNLLKITSAFVHAKQNDFSLHLGRQE